MQLKETGSPSWSIAPLTLAAAALVITALAMFGQYPPGDVEGTRVLQSLDAPGIDTLSDVVYLTGTTPTFQLLALSAATLMFVIRQRLMGGFMVLALLAHNLTFVLKIIVERPRPSPLLVDVARTSDSFSFPSGHVLGAVLLWGFVVFASSRIEKTALRWALASFAFLMMALMGLQRVYTGAHWPSDVLGAYLWGTIIILGLTRLFLLAEDRVAKSEVLATRSDNRQEARPAVIHGTTGPEP